MKHLIPTFAALALASALGQSLAAPPDAANQDPTRSAAQPSVKVSPSPYTKPATAQPVKVIAVAQESNKPAAAVPAAAAPAAVPVVAPAPVRTKPPLDPKTLATSDPVNPPKVDAGKPRVVVPTAIPAVPVSVLRDSGSAADKSKVLDEVADALSNPALTGLRRNGSSSRSGRATFILNESPSILAKPGVNTFIPIAVGHPNRILTPFQTPQVVSSSLTPGNGQECGEVCVRDNVVYISTDRQEPVTAFISEKGREDIAISVTMLPRRIAPREVVFTFPPDVMEQLHEKSIRTGNLAKAEGWERSQPFVDTIRSAMRTIALGEAPQGYNLRRVRATDAVPACSHPGLDVDFSNGQILEGFNLTVYVGLLANKTSGPVEFRAENCGGWRVAAVTSWPLTVLMPGQKTEVYMALHKEDPAPSGTTREPLVPREYN